MNNFRTLSKFAFALGVLSIAISTGATFARAEDANSGTPEQRRLCTPEAMKYCMGSPDGIPGIIKCLRTNPNVSVACKRAMAK